MVSCLTNGKDHPVLTQLHVLLARGRRASTLWIGKCRPAQSRLSGECSELLIDPETLFPQCRFWTGEYTVYNPLSQNKSQVHCMSLSTIVQAFQLPSRSLLFTFLVHISASTSLKYQFPTHLLRSSFFHLSSCSCLNIRRYQFLFL